MGIVSSKCKRKKQDVDDVIIHKNYVQSANASPSISSDHTQCSAISREPTNISTFRYHFHMPSQKQMYSTSMKHIRGQPDFPLFSTPFYLPFNGKSITSRRPPDPYIAQTYNHIDVLEQPSIHHTNRSQTTRSTSTTDSPQVASLSNIVETKDNERRTESYRTLTRVEASITTDAVEQPSRQNLDDGSHLVKRSASAPIDMFLIDISNEHVLIGEPVSMNIRHLLLDTIENHHTNSSIPIRIEPATITTYAHENLLSYIPYVCERYPNVTVESDQLTRNTLHVRAPSEFSRSLNDLK